MDQNTEMLSYIHKNAAMGTRSIPHVLSLPQSGAMRRALSSQLEEYKRIARASEECAKRLGKDVTEPTAAERIMSSMMLRVQTLTDHSTSRLAQLMIQGSTMGTIAMTRRLNQYQNRADRRVVDLGRQLLKTEEANIQQMKAYL